jgi:hypothetical protein
MLFLHDVWLLGLFSVAHPRQSPWCGMGGIDKAKVTNKCEDAVVRLPKCVPMDTVLLQKDYI